MIFPILKRLKENPPVIMDGAMGTMLQSKGLSPGTPSSLWNHEKPEEVKKVYEAYIEAGSELILTNTFTLGHNFNSNIIRLWVNLAQEAKKGDRHLIYVGGSIGPLSIADTSARSIYEKYLECFENNAIDLIVLETMISKKEIAQFLRVYNQSKKIPLMVMMTVNEKGYLPSGENFEEVVSFLNEKEVPIIGFNCSLGPQSLYPYFQTLKKLTDAFIAIKPNAGMPIQKNNQISYPLNPQEFTQWGKRFIDEGVNLIGGCCGTTPEMINNLKLCSQKISRNR